MWRRPLPPRAPILRLLTRKSSNLANLEGIKGETVVGDLSDPASLKSALAGCDAVVHVAADYRLWIPDPAAMYRANVDGTRELLRMAREAQASSASSTRRQSPPCTSGQMGL